MMSPEHVAIDTGRGIGLGLVALGLLRFLRWLIEFAFQRFDINRSQLGLRLKYVENELDAYREATMLLLGVVAKLDAENPALLKVAHILRSIAPRATLDLDELARRLNDMPGKVK
jgi:hypothetical protein